MKCKVEKVPFPCRAPRFFTEPSVMRCRATALGDVRRNGRRIR